MTLNKKVALRKLREAISASHDRITDALKSLNKKQLEIFDTWYFKNTRSAEIESDIAAAAQKNLPLDSINPLISKHEKYIIFHIRKFSAS